VRGEIRTNFCLRCDVPFETRSHRSLHCSACRGDMLREINLRHRQNNRGKARARARFTKMVQRGLILRPPTCSRCGLACKPQGHHADYAKPLEVVWLCRACHLSEHRATEPLPSPDLPLLQSSRVYTPENAPRPVRVARLETLCRKRRFILIYDRPWSEVAS
jgi:hypothetical protein